VNRLIATLFAIPIACAASRAAWPSTTAPARLPVAAESGIEWQDFVDAPFLRAQAASKPILLCVTVRWSLPAVRALSDTLNRPDVREVIRTRYLPILVDADLRPDIRERYSAGGWPAITLLNPLGDPLYYKTVKEKAPRRMTLDLGAIAPETVAPFLRQSADYYRARGSKGNALDRQAVVEEIRQEREKKVGVVDADSLAKVAELLRGNQDVVNGGFGRAPKFLIPTALEAALMLNRRKSDPELVALVQRSLHAAAALEDPVEGGLSRMAGEENWTAVQYEKLLGRNADALGCSVEAWKTTLRDDDLHRATRIAGWILKMLPLPGGGFSYAQTADFASPDGGGYYRASATERPALKRPEILPCTITAPSARAALALLRYASISGDEAARDRALAEIRFLDEKLYSEGRGVQHAWKDGVSLGPLLLDDQLAFIAAHLEAWEQTGLPAHFQRARDTARFVRENLNDRAAGLLIDRIPQRGGPTLMQSPLHSYEQNCEAARLFARLHYIRRDEGDDLPAESSAAPGGIEVKVIRRVSWAALARDILEVAAGRYPSLGPRAGDYALAASEFLDGPAWAFLVGDPTRQPEARALLDAASRMDFPFLMRVVLRPGDDDKTIESLGLNRHGAGCALYFVHENIFSAPVEIPDQLAPAWKALVKVTEGGTPK